MQFRGQAIVNAVLQDLLQLRGMGPGSRLLFGGCSAGARGVMAQLDLVAQDMFARGIEVRGMLDSGIWIDVQPSDPNVESLADETKKVAAFVNPGPLIPGGCSQQYPGDDTWKCLFGQYRMPFLETPYFANEGALPPSIEHTIAPASRHCQQVNSLPDSTSSSPPPHRPRSSIRLVPSRVQ